MAAKKREKRCAPREQPEVYHSDKARDKDRRKRKRMLSLLAKREREDY